MFWIGLAGILIVALIIGWIGSMIFGGFKDAIKKVINKLIGDRE